MMSVQVLFSMFFSKKTRTFMPLRIDDNESLAKPQTPQITALRSTEKLLKHTEIIELCEIWNKQEHFSPEYEAGA